VEWSVGDDPSSSDHLPIAINITGAVVRIGTPRMNILTMIKLTGLVYERSWGLCQSVIMDPFP